MSRPKQESLFQLLITVLGSILIWSSLIRIGLPYAIHGEAIGYVTG